MQASGRKYASGEASRQAILDAAERLMAAQGFAGASISAIEHASGLPASSIYWHFGSKDGVLLEVMRRGADRFSAALSDPGDVDSTPAERLAGTLDAVSRALRRHAPFLQLLIATGLQDDVAGDELLAIIREARRRIRERLESALLPALAALPEAERGSAAADLAAFALAVGDGAFVAGRIDDRELEATFARLRRALTAMIADRAAEPY